MGEPLKWVMLSVPMSQSSHDVSLRHIFESGLWLASLIQF